jgi:hypothetical protein
MFNYVGVFLTIPIILASAHDARSGALDNIAPEVGAILIGVILLLFIVVLRLTFVLRALRKAQSEDAHPETPLDDELELYPPEEELATDDGLEADAVPVFGRLVVLRGLNDRVVSMQCESFVVGRSGEDDCHYVVDRPYVSPQHCEFIYRDGRFFIKDLGSKNGTFVNGERLPREREIIVPIGSEIEVTKNIAFELWDPNTVLDLEKIESTHHSVDSAVYYEDDELAFQAMPGIIYTDDNDEIAEDYSPF